MTLWFFHPLPAKWRFPRSRGWHHKMEERWFMNCCIETYLRKVIWIQTCYLSITLLSHWYLGVVCYNTNLLCLLTEDTIRWKFLETTPDNVKNWKRIGHREIKNYQKRSECIQKETPILWDCVKYKERENKSHQKRTHISRLSTWVPLTPNMKLRTRNLKGKKENEDLSLGPV